MIFLCLIIALFTTSKDVSLDDVVTSQEYVDQINSLGTSWKATLYKDFENKKFNDFFKEGFVRPFYDIPQEERIKENDNSLLKIQFAQHSKNKIRRSTNALFEEKFHFHDLHVNCTKLSRNQGGCGSCWSFGCTHAFNDRLCILYDQIGMPVYNVFTAPQEPVSCPSGGGTCSGGSSGSCTRYIRDNGIVNEKCFKYTGTDSACPSEPALSMECPQSEKLNWKKDRYYVKDYYSEKSKVKVHLELKMHGPMYVSYSVYQDFMSYKTGVYQKTSDTYVGGHAVSLSGWGVDTEDTGLPYWIIKNSWGSNWGKSGYFWIIRGVNEVGIESYFGVGFPDPRCPWYCDDICYDRETVCSGHGKCITQDTCECNKGYYTNTTFFCDYWKCFDYEKTDSEACSGHGECVDKDSCKCVSGFSGMECELSTGYTCYGFNTNQETKVCNGKGKCTAVNTCECNNGYSGDQCELTTCVGINSDDFSNVCGGHGYCVSLDQCKCHIGYSGEECDEWNCYGVSKNNSLQNCYGHGECVEKDICDCDAGFREPYCKQQDCAVYGSFYNDPTNCNAHGKCIGDTCVCESGYELYANRYCRWKCNDILYSQTSTVCSGYVIVIYSEFNHKKRNGDCIDTDLCQCDDGFFGQWCELSSGNACNNIDINNPKVCNGHGTCQASGICSCQSGYLGDFCNWECYGELNSFYMACNGFGRCVDIDTCVCTDGHYGGDCGGFECFGVKNSRNKVCSGRGKCLAKDTCLCDKGFTGPGCEFSSCYGVLSYENDAVCSGNGKCEGLDKCDCDMGAKGAYCETLIKNPFEKLFREFPVLTVFICIALVICCLLLLFGTLSGVVFYKKKKVENNNYRKRKSVESVRTSLNLELDDGYTNLRKTLSKPQYSAPPKKVVPKKRIGGQKPSTGFRSGSGKPGYPKSKPKPIMPVRGGRPSQKPSRPRYGSVPSQNKQQSRNNFQYGKY